MQIRLIAAVCLSLFAVACSGSDGANGTDGVDGNSVLVESSEASTDNCPAGGTTLTFGYDTTGDGAIDDVLATENLCDGEDGAPGADGADGENGEDGQDGNSVLTETAPADVADCPNGGTTVTLGYDTTCDGAIDDVLETANVCDGAPGADGMSVLVETEPATATDCPAGGTSATFGYDTTGDGAIDDVLETATICAGENGSSVLVETAAAAASACPANGTTVTFGYDTTGDGAIDQTLNTTTVCDGEDGADGDAILVESAAAAAGACTTSGTTFTFGYDTTGDGAIDQTVDTTTICDGDQGAPGDELTVEQAAATTCAVGGTTLTFGYDTTGDGSIDTVVETVTICSSSLTSSFAGSAVLYYNDDAGNGDTFLAALQSLQTDGTITLTDSTDPATDIASGNFDIVVFNKSDGNITTSEETALTNWVNGGGAAIFTHWTTSSPLFATFEASATSAALSTANFTGLLGTDLGPVSVTNPFGWGVYSVSLTPVGGGTSACTWDAGGSCAVIGNSGSTVVLGFLMDTVSQADADLIMRNSLAQIAP